MPTFVCEVCLVEFSEEGSRKRRYCSRGCYYVGVGRKQQWHRESRCKHCGSVFVTGYAGQVYCSSACRRAAGRVEVVCTNPQCGKKFVLMKGQTKSRSADRAKYPFCSRGCFLFIGRWMPDWRKRLDRGEALK